MLIALAALAGCASMGGTNQNQGQTSHPQSDLALNATRVLQKQMQQPNNKRIPEDLIANARCIAVFPNIIKAGLILGGQHGEGLVACRQTSNGQAGSGWSQAAPAVYSLSGGSIGLQIGAQKSDVILLFETRDSVNTLLQSHLKFGSDIGLTAGPVGFNANVQTAPSPVVAYVSSKTGLFAGVDLNGSKLDFDQDANAELYSQSAGPHGILLKTNQVPASMKLFSQTLQKFASGANPSP
jgi:lipid-binding SYLF domain-containing protein